MAGKIGRSGGARTGAGRPAIPPVLLPESPVNQTPLDFMLATMRDVTADQRVRLDAAKSAAQYMHLKKGDGGKKDALQAAAQKAMSGVFAPGKPPRLVTISKLLEK